MKISVVLPCYNEEKRIKRTLKEIKRYTKSKNHKFEIIVVDDGSTDKTIKIVRNFDPRIKIIRNLKNQGKGYSVKRGILACTGEISLFMDADSSTNIKELDTFVPYFQNYDVVIGSRAIKGDSIVVPQGFIRRNIGFLAHKLIGLIIRSSIKDTMCGFKAFNRKAKNILFPLQRNNRWGFDYELIFLAEKYGLKIKEAPVKWKDDKESKVTAKGYFGALLELFKIRLNYFLGKYNHKPYIKTVF